MTMTFDRTTPIRIRPKNQITIPEAIATQLGIGPGDRLFARVDESGQLVLRPVPKSYAGAFADIWPDVEAATLEIRAERDAWEDRTRGQLGQ